MTRIRLATKRLGKDRTFGYASRALVTIALMILAPSPGPCQPTILGRGGVSGYGEGQSVPNSLTPFVNFSANYSHSLDLQPTVGADVDNLNAWGYSANAGLSLTHSGKSSILGLSYMGTYHGYSGNSEINSGFAHVASLAYGARISSKADVSTMCSGETSPYGIGTSYGMQFGGLGSYGVNITDPISSMSPGWELFNYRWYALGCSANVSYRLGRRLSVGAGGYYQMIRRRRDGVASSNTTGASGDISYAVGKRSSVGVDYYFNYFYYPHGFGDSFINSAAVNYATNLSRNTVFKLRGGGYRAEVLALHAFTVDPAIAAIIGASTGTEVIHALRYGGVGDVSLSRTFQRSSLSFQGSIGVFPGNGVYLTSRRNWAGVSYNHMVSKRWGVGLTANHERYNALMQNAAPQKAYEVTGSGSFKISRILFFTSSVAYRTYTTGQMTGYKNYIYATAGIGLSPQPILFR